MSISVDDTRLDSASSVDELAADARRGLTARPKALPPRWFYDARGSELFEQITELPEYYPTRTERAILEQYADDIAAAAPVNTVVELGSGSSIKTRLLLDAWQRAGSLHRIVTVDVSISALTDAAAELSERYGSEDYGGVEVRPVRADFTRHLTGLDTTGRTAIVFLGSTIGNLDPAERAEFFASVRNALRPGDVLLLGTDLVKSQDVLVPAYDDAAGVTAQFNLNLLRVLNRGLDGDLPVDAFSHHAVWNIDAERIEMRLRADRELTARLAAIDLDVHFDAGEEMLTEISSKFRRKGVSAELAAAGLHLDRWWSDEKDYFAVSLSS
jgi:L-histidine N-alpha-methyltransferase